MKQKTLRTLILSLFIFTPNVDASQVQIIGLSQYQQLNLSTKNYPMQTNLIISNYENETYPQLIIGFDADFKLGVGSVFNYTTDDYFFFNESQKNISMTQIRDEQLQVKGVMGYENGYVELGFAETVSLTVNKNNSLTISALGLNIKAMKWAQLKAHYYVGQDNNNDGSGYKVSVSMPIQLFDIQNELKLTSIAMDWDAAPQMPEWTGFYNHYEEIKKLLYTNSNAIIINNEIEYHTDLFKVFLRYSYLDSPSHYLAELGSQFGINAQTQLQFKIASENEQSIIIGGVTWRGSF